MSFESDFAAAIQEVSHIRTMVDDLAEKYGLTIRRKTKLKPWKHPWPRTVALLELESEEPEYRAQFQITLSEKGLRVWSLVTDLRTHQWQQDIREDVLVSMLAEVAAEVLANVDGWMAANEGIDPIEARKAEMGTAFYWRFSREDGMPMYSTDFDGSDWGAEVFTEMDEGSLSDPDGEVKEFTGGRVVSHRFTGGLTSVCFFSSFVSFCGGSDEDFVPVLRCL